jgi:hypothetical protein
MALAQPLVSRGCAGARFGGNFRARVHASARPGRVLGEASAISGCAGRFRGTNCSKAPIGPRGVAFATDRYSTVIVMMDLTPLFARSLATT